MSGANSKATTVNPKDLLGGKKVPLGQVLPVAMAHEACAMLDGDLKYGFRNWREKSVISSIYIDAALRHLQQWSEGEENAEDSGVHHLGHARACLGIILDAQANGNLIDNRAKGVFGKVQAELSAWVEKRMQKAKDAVAPAPKLKRFEYYTDLDVNTCPPREAICEECKQKWGSHYGIKCDIEAASTRRWTIKVK